MPVQRKQFAVIGLGRFGSAVCKTLHDMGHEVMGMDVSEEMTHAAHADDICTHVVRLDSTDIHALDEIGMRTFDTVFVAIGADLESSILTVLNLVDLGVKNLVAKASHDKHGKLLSRVGGDNILVIYPETQMGERVAKAVSGGGIIESIELDPSYSIIEIPAPPELVGKTLTEANLRARFGVTVIAIKGKTAVNIAPLGHDVIKDGDLIAVIGPNDRLMALQR